MTVDFIRKGKRIERRKIKKGKMARKQEVANEEIIQYLEKNLGTKIIGKSEEIEK